MKISQCIGCRTFPCRDVEKHHYVLPGIDLQPNRIRIILISEAAPPERADYYYAAGSPSFAQTTLQAFRDAGADFSSIRELVDHGIYLTTAVKCGKTAYAIQTGTIKECSALLEKELDFFPNVRAFLLMGDVAIKAFNYISARKGGGRAVPAGSTYKIRGQKHEFRGARLFPSYLQVGPSFNIEKSKRRMIAQDIASALRLLK